MKAVRCVSTLLLLVAAAATTSISSAILSIVATGSTDNVVVIRNQLKLDDSRTSRKGLLTKSLQYTNNDQPNRSHCVSHCREKNTDNHLTRDNTLMSSRPLWKTNIRQPLRISPNTFSSFTVTRHSSHPWAIIRGGAILAEQQDESEENDYEANDGQESDNSEYQEYDNEETTDNEREEEEENEPLDTDNDNEEKIDEESLLPSTESLVASLQSKSNHPQDSQSQLVAATISKATQTTQTTTTTTLQYDTLLTPPARHQFFLSLSLVFLSNRINLSSPKVVRIIRLAFLAYLALSQLFLLYVSWKVRTLNDQTMIVVQSFPSLTSLFLPGSGSGGNNIVQSLASNLLSTQTTVRDYDLKQVKTMINSLLLPMVILYFLHFKLGQVQPLVMQTATGLLNLVYSPLWQVYVGGRRLERPFGSGVKEREKSHEEERQVEEERQAEEDNEEDYEDDGDDTEYETDVE